jgi:hypothetical protein
MTSPHPDQGDTRKALQIRLQQAGIAAFHTEHYQTGTLKVQGSIGGCNPWVRISANQPAGRWNGSSSLTDLA